MSLLVRLLLVYLAAGLLIGWALRRWLRSLAPARANGALLALALAPFTVHALDTALRVAPRGGVAVALGYALAALLLAVAGALLGWRWRAGPRLPLLPVALAAAALPASWILGAALRRAGETTDAIPLLVYLGATMVAAVALGTARLRIPSPRRALARRSDDAGDDASDDAQGDRSGAAPERTRVSVARIAGRLVSALFRRLQR